MNANRKSLDSMIARYAEKASTMAYCDPADVLYDLRALRDVGAALSPTPVVVDSGPALRKDHP